MVIVLLTIFSNKMPMYRYWIAGKKIAYLPICICTLYTVHCTVVISGTKKIVDGSEIFNRIPHVEIGSYTYF